MSTSMRSPEISRNLHQLSRNLQKYPPTSSFSTNCRDSTSSFSIARIGWELPPQLAKVLPNSRAARVGTELRPGDELVEVNGTDVTELEQGWCGGKSLVVIGGLMVD